MLNKLKDFRKNIVKYVTQIYADYLYERLKKEEDRDQFLLFFEQAALLNAYCIVFHDIYLD